jgi:hypothetical protein
MLARKSRKQPLGEKVVDETVILKRETTDLWRKKMKKTTKIKVGTGTCGSLLRTVAESCS